MLLQKLILVTVLLTTLSYSGVTLYTSVCVFVFTIFATYICYALNTQLRLENYIHKFPFLHLGSHNGVSTQPFVQNDGFNSFPKPIAKILEKFIDSIQRDFIQSWYVYIGPDEQDFLEEVKIALEHIVVQLNAQLTTINIHRLTADLIRMFQRHIKTFSECQDIIQKKYPNLPESSFSPLISELYEEAVVKHVATKSKGAELDYLKTLVDMLLHKYVPPDAFSCLGGRFLLREILAIQLLEPLVKVITEPHFVNEIVIDILEPSLPMSVILKKWRDAMEEIKNEEEEEEREEEQHSVPLSPTQDYDASSPETNYESTYEHMPSVPEKKRTKRNIRQKKKLFTPSKYSSSEYSDNDEQGQDDFIRFNKLDTRTSNIVYGLTSARDHEKPNDFRQNDAMTNQREQNASENSDGENRVKYSEPIIESRSWTMLPPSNDQMFQHKSFQEMPLNQDKMTEQIKARINSSEIGTIILNSPISCFTNSISPTKDDIFSDDDVQDAPRTIQNNDESKELIMSIDGSVTMEFYSQRQQTTLKGDENKESVKGGNKKEEFLQVHKSGETGAFYEMAPSCPTCIEMTLLASPFENEKAQIVLNEKERAKKEKKERKKVIEHECGLVSEHFCNRQTDTESIIADPFLDTSSSSLVLSCSDIGNEISNNSFSSGTLLASVESFGEEDETEPSSFDNISDVSSEVLREEVMSYDDYSGVPPSKLKTRDRKYSTAASSATFKTAIESDSTANQHPPTGKKGKQDRHLFRIFHKNNVEKKKHKYLKKIEVVKKRKDKGEFEGEVESKMDTSSISTSHTKFQSIPDNQSSSLPSHWNSKTSACMDDLVEEIGFEVEEDDIDDVGSISTYVDPLSKEIAVTDVDLLEVKSVKSQDALPQPQQQYQQDPQKSIPIYQGKVIMPSKLPATWLYPIQMISIPSTEVALEKGWEPGINKYTLYKIHYDIRIWPDLYQKQVKEASTLPIPSAEKKPEPVPLIREIKRRYREFLYLHNRLTHGAFSKHMKGILRPNRRYAMPFGRMDPDVIEGRRKILETYLVSLVSRPELCNCREFKDFLGSDEFDDETSVKLRKTGQKKLYKNQVQNVITETKQDLQPGINVHRETVDRMNAGLNSQYFIHGYVVPRMFGYSLDDDIAKHSKLILSHYVLNYPRFNRQLHQHFETVQKPQMFHIPVLDMMNNGTPPGRSFTIDSLGPRTDGDGAEEFPPAKISPQEDNHQLNVKKEEFSFNQSIAAKFSQELAAKLREEKEHLASRIAHEKNLYESSWPITDAVLSITSQILKGYKSWITFERVQQAILFSLGGIIEWLIGCELEEVIMRERCFKYLTDLYFVVWDKQENLKSKKPEPTAEEKMRMKKRVVARVMEYIPSFVRISIGTSSYKECCINLVKCLQYQNINRHVFYAALEVILDELVPEVTHDHPSYVGVVENTTVKK